MNRSLISILSIHIFDKTHLLYSNFSIVLLLSIRYLRVLNWRIHKETIFICTSNPCLCLKPFTTLYFDNTYVQPKILWWPYLESCWPLEILPEWFWRPIMKKVFDWQTKIRGHKVNPKKGKHQGQWKPGKDLRPLV